MKIVNIFDAVKEGNINEFERLYNGSIDIVNEYTELNLLETLLLKNDNSEERLAIAKMLIDKGIDINFKDSKNSRNALHVLYFNFLRGDVAYLKEITKILIDAGIEINSIDKYKAIPLKYALTICKMKTEELITIYEILLKKGSDFTLKDSFDKSCLDYAEVLSWRREFIDLVKVVDNDK